MRLSGSLPTQKNQIRVSLDAKHDVKENGSRSTTCNVPETETGERANVRLQRRFASLGSSSDPAHVPGARRAPVDTRRVWIRVWVGKEGNRREGVRKD